MNYYSNIIYTLNDRDLIESAVESKQISILISFLQDEISVNPIISVPLLGAVYEWLGFRMGSVFLAYNYPSVFSMEDRSVPCVVDQDGINRMSSTIVDISHVSEDGLWEGCVQLLRMKVPAFQTVEFFERLADILFEVEEIIVSIWVLYVLVTNPIISRKPLIQSVYKQIEILLKSSNYFYKLSNEAVTNFGGLAGNISNFGDEFLIQFQLWIHSYLGMPRCCFSGNRLIFFPLISE